MKKSKGTRNNNQQNKLRIFFSVLLSTIFLSTMTYASNSIDSSSLQSSAEISVSSGTINGQSPLCHLTKGLLLGCDISNFTVPNCATPLPHPYLTITNTSGIDALNVTADLSAVPSSSAHLTVDQTPSAGCTAPAYGSCTLTYCTVYISMPIGAGPYYVTVAGTNTNPIVVSFNFT